MDENNHDRSKIAASGNVETSRPFEAAGSPWNRFWSRLVADPEPSVAHRLYETLVRHARFPIYFDRLGTPDTPEGRFEILALHVGLVVRRLYSLDDEGRLIGQALFDLMVADLDSNLRELGVGDLSVGKQVKRLAGQFYARLGVLNDAFDDERTDVLEPMLATNLYGTGSPPEGALSHLAEILARLEETLRAQRPDAVKAGRITLLEEEELIALCHRQRRDDDRQ